MKINKLVITIFFSAVGLFVSTALQAQEAKTLFVNMPDSLSPLLTKVNREDCIDFLESKMKAQVENRFGKKSEMTDLGKDYIRMQMSVQSTWQMKVLALNDSTNVICTEGKSNVGSDSITLLPRCLSGRRDNKEERIDRSRNATSSEVKSWYGLAYERVCQAHLPQIKQALGIASVKTVLCLFQILLPCQPEILAMH